MKLPINKKLILYLLKLSMTLFMIIMQRGLFFTDHIHLAYRSYVGRNVKGKEKLIHATVKRCPYCENFFDKNGESINKHMKVCAAKEGITYCFNNGELILSQNNFRHLGDVPFTVYVDFETTTGDAFFFEPKMFVISYCQIYTFQPKINLEKIVKFRGFQQSALEIYDLSNFKQEHVPFFDKATFSQLKDAAPAMFAREKSTSH